MIVGSRSLILERLNVIETGLKEPLVQFISPIRLKFAGHAYSDLHGEWSESSGRCLIRWHGG